MILLREITYSVFIVLRYLLRGKEIKKKGYGL